MTKFDAHLYYLHEFIKPFNLKPVFAMQNISLDTLVSIIIEPTYYTDNGMEHQSMCDYLFLFEDNLAIPAELKGSKAQKPKAKKQLAQGKYYGQNVLDYRVDSGLFVVYNPKQYYTEFLPL